MVWLILLWMPGSKDLKWNRFVGKRWRLELWVNLVYKIGLKYLIPVSNCFYRRKSFVVMQMPLKSQIASSSFRHDPLSWLDDLSRGYEISLLLIQWAPKKFPSTISSGASWHAFLYSLLMGMKLEKKYFSLLCHLIGPKGKHCVPSEGWKNSVIFPAADPIRVGSWLFGSDLELWGWSEGAPWGLSYFEFKSLLFQGGLSLSLASALMLRVAESFLWMEMDGGHWVYLRIDRFLCAHLGQKRARQSSWVLQAPKEQMDLFWRPRTTEEGAGGSSGCWICGLWGLCSSIALGFSYLQ